MPRLLAYLLALALSAPGGLFDQPAALMRRGDYAAADRQYERLAEQGDADAPRARLLQARAALADGRTTDAEADLQRLFSDYPGSDQESSGLITLEQVRRSADDCRGAMRALDAYQTSLHGAADPLGPYTPLQRAQCAGQLGDWPAELSAAQQALAIDGGGPRLTRIEAYEREADAFQKLGRKQDALDAYNQDLALASTRGYTSEMLFTTASVAHALGQDALATDRFYSVVVDYPDSARAPGALDTLSRMGLAGVVSPYQAGLVHVAAHQDATAASDFEQVDASSRDAGPAHLKHAAALLRLGRSEAARQELQATADAYPAEAGEALLQLGQAYERGTDYVSAETAYARAGQAALHALADRDVLALHDDTDGTQLGSNFRDFAFPHFSGGAHQLLLHFGERRRLAEERLQRRHARSGDAAGHDGGEVAQVGAHVEGKAVAGDPARDVHADRAQLSRRRPDADAARAALGGQTVGARRADHHLFHRGHVLAHVLPVRLEVEDVDVPGATQLRVLQAEVGRHPALLGEVGRDLVDEAR